MKRTLHKQSIIPVVILLSTILVFGTGAKKKEKKLKYSRKLAGPVLTKNTKGKIIKKGNISEDALFTGVINQYYDNGEIFETANYDHNRPDGDFKQYYLNGKVKEQRKYNKGFLHGAYKTFYPNGKKKMVANYYMNLLDGEVMEFSEEGKPLIKMVYDKGDLIRREVIQGK